VAPFGVRLQAAMEQRGPLCVGIDPHPELLAAWELPDTPSGLERFALSAAEAMAPHVAAVKPQSAFFERHGSAGVAVLERTLAIVRATGTPAVLDVKRGDIGSTATAYAQAYLDPASPLAADAVTVSPYLGFGSLQPFLDTARSHGGGLFVLTLTSNPEGQQVQGAVRDGRTVAGALLAAVAAQNADRGAQLGSVGCVVGATLGSTPEDLDVGGPLLVPGLGAQGGTPQGLRALFAGVLDRVLAASSREVLAAGPEPQRLRDAALSTTEQLRAALQP
jgi:orotidine-5'-phosphate decarboxylase